MDLCVIILAIIFFCAFLMFYKMQTESKGNNNKESGDDMGKMSRAELRNLVRKKEQSVAISNDELDKVLAEPIEAVNDTEFSDENILDKIDGKVEKKNTRINFPTAPKKDEIKLDIEKNEVEKPKKISGSDILMSKEYLELLDKFNKINSEKNQLEEQKSSLQRQLDKTNNDIVLKDQKIKELEINQVQNNNKEENNEKEMKIVELNEKIENMSVENGKLKSSLQATTKRIQELNNVIEESKQAKQAMIAGNKKMLEENKQLKEENHDLIESLNIVQDKFEKDMKTYQSYVRELTSDIREFEAAYVAIGGDLHDIYEDYDEYE